MVSASLSTGKHKTGINRHVLKSCLEHLFPLKKLSYLTESEHLVWGLLEGHGDLGQVGGAPPQQTLLRAAGWNKERRPSSKLLHPVLQLLRLKVTGVCSPRAQCVCVCAGGFSRGFKSCRDNRASGGCALQVKEHLLIS